MQSENLFLSKYIEIPMSPYLLFIFHALTVRSRSTLTRAKSFVKISVFIKFSTIEIFRKCTFLIWH